MASSQWCRLLRISTSRTHLTSMFPKTINSSLTRTQFRFLSRQQGDDDDDKQKGLFVVDKRLEKQGDPPIPEDDASIVKKEPADDPFGVNFEDGAERLGPTLPPQYKRDATTGRFTGEVVPDSTPAGAEVENPVEVERRLMKGTRQKWYPVDKSGRPMELHRLGQRIRRAEMGLNVLGRSADPKLRQKSSDKKPESDSSVSRSLSESEFATFAAFMDKKYKYKVDKTDIPVQHDKEGRGKRTSRHEDDADTPDVAMQWLSIRAKRQMDDSVDDDPFADLSPGALSPTRLVNRKRAKPIPRKLLHHNNIPLLQRYLTPTGQIRNRVQTRLGTRDQRRVAKLIKRARNLGLLPYSGQWKVESHGWIHEDDIDKNRSFEDELERRGLVVRDEGGEAEQRSER